MFALDQVVPWGRSFDEYRRMFALSEDDLRSRILGCADGPASFNAEALLAGHRVVSCDPLYRYTGDQIRERVQATSEVILEQTRRNAALRLGQHPSTRGQHRTCGHHIPTTLRPAGKFS